MFRGKASGGRTASLRDMARYSKQYAMVALGGLGLTGGRAPSGPLQAQIGICDPCNHECVFCWDHPPGERFNEDTENRFGGDRAGVMPLATFKGIVDDLHRLGTRRIDLIGRGEPLLNKAALDMIQYAKGRGFQVLLCSNASKLSERVARGMVSAGLDRMNVSLNAGTPENYPNIHVTETPENYRKVKQNLRRLADLKTAADSGAPFVSLSFVITAKNYFEISSMVEVAGEVGAEEAAFVHTTLHAGTPDLALTPEQYHELMASIPAARSSAAALGVQTNLDTFEATVPTYLKDELVGPPVVPCYVGWYFTVVLGNGSVMPCCQCAAPLGTVSEDRRFADIWSSPDYAAFRTAAKRLPQQSERLHSCECDRCQLRPRNIAIHNFLHPLNPIDGGDAVQRFTPRDFLAKVQGKHGPRSA